MALITLSNKSIQTIKGITNSVYLDFIGLVIVISASLALGYHNTVFNFTFQLGMRQTNHGLKNL